MLLTAHRLAYAQTTLRSTLERLTDDEPLRVHIASDGDDPDYVNNLMGIAHEYVGEWVTFSNSEGQGYGANYNAATQVIHNLGDVEYVLPLEDDWELRQQLNLGVLRRCLSTGLGCIRLGYLGFTQELRGTFVRTDGGLVLHLDSASSEPHIFAGHPRFETVEWERSVGPWPEGLNPGTTEFTVAHYEAARKGVCWPIEVVQPCGDVFAHIGAERSY